MKPFSFKTIVLALFFIISIGCSSYNNKWQAVVPVLEVDGERLAEFKVKMNIASKKEGKLQCRASLPQTVDLEYCLVHLDADLKASGVWRLEGGQLFIALREYDVRIPAKSIYSTVPVDGKDEALAADFIDSVVDQFGCTSNIKIIASRISERTAVKQVHRRFDERLQNLIIREQLFGSIQLGETGFTYTLSPGIKEWFDDDYDSIVFHLY